MRRDKSKIPQKLKFFCANLRSINNKIPEFQTYLCYDKIDIFFICETHLNDDILDSMICTNYTIYRNDRNIFGGGVMIGIKY